MKRPAFWRRLLCFFLGHKALTLKGGSRLEAIGVQLVNDKVRFSYLICDCCGELFVEFGPYEPNQEALKPRELEVAK